MGFIGVDVASVDGNKLIDWAAAKAAGCRFAIIRGSYVTWKDPTFRRECDRARAAGIIVGAYLFPVMGVSAPPAATQIQSFVASVGQLTNRDLPPTLDVEFPGGIAKTGRTRKELLQWVREAINGLRTAYGVAPMIYTSARVWDGEDSDSLDADRNGLGEPSPELLECPLWLARYPYKTRIPAIGDTPAERLTVDGLPWPPVPKAWGDADNVWIHQYQGDAIQFPGFSSTADLNRFHPIAIGYKGERVRWLQRRLRMIEGTPGVFELATHEALGEFQRDNGLTPDHVLGPATFAALCWS